MPLICKVCSIENSYGTTICKDCGQPLTTEMTRILVTKTNEDTKQAVIDELMPMLTKGIIERFGLQKIQNKNVEDMSQKEKDAIIEKLMG